MRLLYRLPIVLGLALAACAHVIRDTISGGARFLRDCFDLFRPEPLRLVDRDYASHLDLNIALHDRPRAGWLNRVGLMNTATSPRQLQPG